MWSGQRVAGWGITYSCAHRKQSPRIFQTYIRHVLESPENILKESHSHLFIHIGIITPSSLGTSTLIMSMKASKRTSRGKAIVSR